MDKKRDSVLLELEELNLIYYEIINGSSFCPQKSLYIKHFSEKENFLIQKKKNQLVNEYVEQGIPTKSELLENAIKNEEWSEEKENKILELKYAISDNEKNLHNIIPQQRSFIKKIIDKHKEELSDLLFEKTNAIGKGIEDLVVNNTNEYLSFLSFFKDEECKISAFESFEAFEKIDFEELLTLNNLIASNNEKISESQIKKIATMPFFLNKFSYSKEDITKFLGIPIYKLTYNQINLFSFGIRNLNVLSNAKGNPPDLSLDGTPESLVNWYDIQNSILISKRNESN